MGKKVQLKVDGDNKTYPKIHNNYILVSMPIQQKITDTTPTKVLFSKVLSSYGDELTLESNGIKIGKGINKIRIDLTLWAEAYAGYSMFMLYKNGEELTKNLQSEVPDNFGKWRTCNAFTFCDVAEGDLIYAIVFFSMANPNNNIAGFYNNSCLLGVQVID